MINELNEKMKEYSHEYFVKEFRNSKPSIEYNELEYKIFVTIAALVVVGVIGGLLLVCRVCECPKYYWVGGALVPCLLGGLIYFFRLNCKKTKILLEMANAYFAKHGDIRGKLPNAPLKTARARNKYIRAIENAYRAEIVRQYLGNEYTISTIKTLKDEVEIKDVKLGLSFASICSFLGLSVSVVAWFGFDIEKGWPIALCGVLFLLAVHVGIYVAKLGGWEFCKSKKHKELRDTLSFILYDYM